MAARKLEELSKPDLIAFNCTATSMKEGKAGDAAILDQAFDNAPIGMAVVDPDGRLLRVNPAFQQLLGMTTQALVGTTFAAITHPEDVDADLGLFGEVLAGEDEDGVVEELNVEQPGDFKVSSAEHMLEQL